MADVNVDLDAQIKCVEREIALRVSAYPRFVAAGRFTQEKADYELKAMRAVLATLMSVKLGPKLI